ncbi:MAG: hypothetical protein LLG04_07990 [Parachlamydia sp.]|nr:hypothetical protein [Parachlamydia sp.]
MFPVKCSLALFALSLSLNLFAENKERREPPKATPRGRVAESGSGKAKIKLTNCASITDESLLILAKNTRNIEELDLSWSLVNDEQLQKVIPALATSSPDLKSINLKGSYISPDTFRWLLDAFPLLEKLNIDWVDIPTEQLRHILLPWIKNNSNLKSLKSYDVKTPQQLQELVDAIPVGLQELTLYVYPHPITPEIMDNVFPNLAAKCGQNLLSLHISGGYSVGTQGNYYAIEPRHFKTLPQHLPYLEDLHFDGGCTLTSAEYRDTYLQWQQAKVLNFSDLYELNGNDAAQIIQHFSTIEEVKFCGYSEVITTQELQTIASALVNSQSQSLRNLALPDLTPFQEKGIDPSLITLQPLFAQLESIDLNWFGINNEDMIYLGEVLGGPNLKEIWVSLISYLNQKPRMTGNVFTPAFQKIAERSRNLHTLGLNGLLFSYQNDDNKEQFTKIIQYFTKLRHVNLYRLEFFIPDELVRPLVLLIKNNPDLECIQTSLTADEIETLTKLSPSVGHTVFISGE